MDLIYGIFIQYATCFSSTFINLSHFLSHILHIWQKHSIIQCGKMSAKLSSFYTFSLFHVERKIILNHNLLSKSITVLPDDLRQKLLSIEMLRSEKGKSIKEEF